nr:hypothetical protein [uncultured Albidiferax sp.]
MNSPDFDALDLGSGENQLLGSASADEQHFAIAFLALMGWAREANLA